MARTKPRRLLQVHLKNSNSYNVMKSINYSLLLATIAFIGAVACNKVEEVQISPEKEQPGIEYICRIVDSDTKTTLEGNVVTWEINDPIGYYSSTDTYNSYKKITTISPVVTFPVYLTNTLNANDELYAYFPYKENASASTDGPTKVKMSIPASQSNDFDAMPQVSKVYKATSTVTSGSTIDLEFLNLGSVAQFIVYSSVASYRNEVVRSISFTANKACAGDFLFDVTGVDYENPSSLEIDGYSESTVTVTASPTIGSTKDDAGSVNMVLAPGDYSGTVIVTTNEATYSYTISSPKSFVRAGLKPLGIRLDAEHRTPLPKKTYQKITSEPADWEGEYILVNSDGTYVMTGNLSGNYLEATSITANLDGTITCFDSYSFEIEKISDGVYALKNSSGKYISLNESGSTNATLLDNTSTDNSKFEITLSPTGLATINSKLQNTRYLTFSTSNDWRFYANSNNRGYFYALSDSRIFLDTPVVEVSVSGTTINASWGVVANAASYDVTLSGSSPVEVTETSKSFTGLPSGTYTVTVVAKPLDAVTYRDSAAGVSANAVVGTPTLAAPTITTLDQTNTGFSAAWTAGDAYATGYDWEFREGSTTGTVLGSGSTSTLTLAVPFSSLSIDKFTNGTKYYFLLSAKATGYTSSVVVNDNFTASSSTEVSITTFSKVSGAIDSNISYAAVKGDGTTDPAINSSKLRLYKPASGKSTGGKLTVTAASGYKITDITFRSNNGQPCKYSTDGGSLSKAHTMGSSAPLVISGISAQTVEYYNTGSDKIDINTIEVTYTVE